MTAGLLSPPDRAVYHPNCLTSPFNFQGPDPPPGLGHSLTTGVAGRILCRQVRHAFPLATAACGSRVLHPVGMDSRGRSGCGGWAPWEQGEAFRSTELPPRGGPSGGKWLGCFLTALGVSRTWWTVDRAAEPGQRPMARRRGWREDGEPTHRAGLRDGRPFLLWADTGVASESPSR